MPCPYATTDLDNSDILVAGVEPAKAQPRTYAQSRLVALYMHGDTTVSASSSKVLLMARE